MNQVRSASRLSYNLLLLDCWKLSFAKHECRVKDFVKGAGALGRLQIYPGPLESYEQQLLTFRSV